MVNRVLVAGATGGTGQYIVKKLLARDWPVRALVRDVARARAVLGDQVDLIVADVTVPATLPAAFREVTHCICTIGSNAVQGKQPPEAIDYGGVVNLANAARESGIQHFVLVSSIGVTQPDHPINRYGQVLTWKLRGEEYLRASNIPYTIVRPGGLKDAPGGYGVQFGQGDQISGTISRADTAEVCVQALGCEAAFGKTFEIIADEAQPAGDYLPVFTSLKAD